MRPPQVGLQVAVVGVVLVLVSLGPVGQAFHVEDPPNLLHEGGAAGEGWVVFAFDPHGGHVVIDLDAPKLQGTNIVQTGLMRYDGQLDRKFGSIGTRLYSDDGGVYLDSNELGGDDPTVDTYATWSQDGGPVMGYQFNEAREAQEGPMYILLWVVGGVQEHGYRFYGTAAVELLDVVSGTSATLHDTTSFEGTAVARTSASILGARAAVSASTETSVEGILLGTFTSGFSRYPTHDDLSMVGPDGTNHVCPCTWAELVDPSGMPPGEYSFYAEGASVGNNGGSHLRLTVVDVPHSAFPSYAGDG